MLIKENLDIDKRNLNKNTMRGNEDVDFSYKIINTRY